MTDTTTILPTTNRQIAIDQGKQGWGKTFATAISVAVGSYTMNQLSLHGINFDAEILPGLKIPSEMVKSGIEMAVTTAFFYATPSHFVAFVKDVIIFIKQSLRTWKQAWTDNE